MPELRCTVDTCMHNKQFYCELDEISVGGNQAKRSRDTSCESFEERKGNSYSNAVEGSAPSPVSAICCQACDCVYNDNQCCEAGKISVEGHSACNCGDTECASFRCK
jgi:hypothetical protein